MSSVEIKEQERINNKIDLAVCILFYEKVDQTIECIRSLLPSGANIYVLNNGSSSSSRRALGRFCEGYGKITIFDSTTNKGVSVGRNCLISHTTEEWLLFIDNDIVIKTDAWWQKLDRYIYMYEDVEVFIPKLFNIHQNSFIWRNSIRIVGNKAKYDQEIINDLTNVFPGGASIINRKLFDRLGIYDEKMFVGFEDFEFGIRAILNGKPVKARLIHDIVLFHDHRSAKRVEEKNAALIRYDSNRLETSFNRITEKHNIVLEDNWRPWANDQIENITRKQMFAFWKHWKLRICNVTKRILRKCYRSIFSFR